MSPVRQIAIVVRLHHFPRWVFRKLVPRLFEAQREEASVGEPIVELLIVRRGRGSRFACAFSYVLLGRLLCAGGELLLGDVLA